MEFAQRTLDDLGFAEITAALAQRCRSEMGRRRALARPFLANAEEVLESLARVEDARRLQEQQYSLPLGSLPDVRGPVERAAKGGLLEPKELLDIAQMLLAFIRTREALEERENLAPRPAMIGRRLPPLEALARRVDGLFESSGEISDRASSALREARDRVRGLHRSIKSKLDGLLHDEKFLPNLREGYYTLRNERYVVPVLAQHRAEVPGIVHNASQSGQTLFVEPQPLIGMGNDLAIAQSLVLEEERRILQEASEDLGRYTNQILEGIDAAAELDELEAAARLAADLRAQTPTLSGIRGALDLRSLRHPLLVLRDKEVVANDVTLSGESRALVISGPNAGGKTVTLTGVGLCSLMLRAGLPIPVAEGSSLPLYRSIHSTVGDAQDLAQDLSTFSAHVAQLRQILREASEGSLVLIDEIAADTDPREGAA
ncbi:MAG: endonuclease MutS2, partial [Myxococcaceae bacterium]